MWEPSSKVEYTARSGRKSVRTICVTAEGFAVIVENGEEILFSGNGKPINTSISPETGGPRIQLLNNKPKAQQPPKQKNYKNNKNKNHQKDNEPNYKKATFEQPWDNIFAIKNLTITKLNELTQILVDAGYGNEKLHLKNFGKSANIEDRNKIKQLFLESKEKRGR